MIVLDTNVVSEPMRPNADARVVAWLDEQAVETLYITAVSVSELLLGLEMLPDGKRKQRLAMVLDGLLQDLFGTRILPFDHHAAVVYAKLMADARAQGAAISAADGQIAAIAVANGFVVASRDQSPFAAAGLEVLNPWSFAGRSTS